MTDRDRLIELITEKQLWGIDQIQPNGFNIELFENEDLADHLLANGVFILPEDLRGTEDFSISAFFEAMKMYKQKERYIKLPCKVGDKLFVISQMKDKRILPFVNQYEVTSIRIGKKKCVVYHEKDGFIKIFKQDDFGKTVFLSEEQANKKIKGVKQK